MAVAGVAFVVAFEAMAMMMVVAVVFLSIMMVAMMGVLSFSALSIMVMVAMAFGFVAVMMAVEAMMAACGRLFRLLRGRGGLRVNDLSSGLVRIHR